jgi:hypothetical protein
VNLLFLNPDGSEIGLMFRDVCSAYFSDHLSMEHYQQNHIGYYINRYGENYRFEIETDIEHLFTCMLPATEDAVDRLTPLAEKTIMETHSLWSPQANITIRHVSSIACHRLGIDYLHPEVIDGVGRLYCYAARNIRNKCKAGT